MLMKAIFVISKEIDIMEQLESIANKYNSVVHLDDDEISHYILIKPRLKVMQRVEPEHYTLEIFGAKEEDINYFKHLWGEPQTILEEKLTPQEFAFELINIPAINEKSKEEILTHLNIDERTFMQYSRFLERFKGRSDASNEIQKAIEIVKNLN